MEKIREQIAQILKNNITFSGQVGGYVIHGAIDEIVKLIESNSKEVTLEEKPDFEKMAQETDQYIRLRDEGPPTVSYILFSVAYQKGCEKIWNDYVIPLRKALKLA